MVITGLGLIPVATPGSPVAVVPASKNVTTAYFQAQEGGIGKTYLKDASGNLIRVFWPTGADGAVPEPFLLGPYPAEFDLSTLNIDADEPGEGLVVACASTY